jgi:hypothetical protein
MEVGQTPHLPVAPEKAARAARRLERLDSHGDTRTQVFSMRE